MALSITRYVDITSGVGAGATVKQRELILRLMTENPLVPTGSLIECESASEVLSYFGSTSEEYKRASVYFSFIDKRISSPKKISFARWASENVAATIYGTTPTKTLATWQAITNGDFTLLLGGASYHVTGLDFSAVTSLADVAAEVQSGIRANSGQAAFATATVTYNATRSSFDFVSGTTGDIEISLSAGTTANVLLLLGWGSQAILSNGVLAQTVSDVLTETANGSDNFGSLEFMTELTIDDHVLAGSWVHGENQKYQYMVPVKAEDAVAWSEALIGYSGVALTLVADTNTEYDEMSPAMKLAATDYTKRNVVANYMFYQFDNLTAKVTDDSVADTYDNLRVNYYGQTQSAGQKIAFYQRGYLCGGSTAATQIGVYANEQWFKAKNTASLLELLLNLDGIDTTDQGRATVLAQLQDGIDQALYNGTIKVGKELTSTQKLYVSTVTGDENAWLQIQSTGYWVDATVTQTTTSGGTVEYTIDYTILYAKADMVNKITGTHTLI